MNHGIRIPSSLSHKHVPHRAVCLRAVVLGCWIVLITVRAVWAIQSDDAAPPELPRSSAVAQPAPTIDDGSPPSLDVSSASPPALDLPPSLESTAEAASQPMESHAEHVPVASGTGTTGTDASTPAVSADSHFVSNLVAWIGKFHPATVHFPIALLSLAALAELLFLFTKNSGFQFTARFSIALGAASALLSGTLGWCLAGLHLSDPNWVMTTHRWLGTSTVVVALAALAASEMRCRRKNFRMNFWYHPLLFTGAVLVLTTGYFGGVLVFGLNHYAWPGTIEASKNREAESSSAATKPTAVVQMTDDWTFEPAKVTIKVGETVLWECGKKYSHTVTADPSKAKNPDDVQIPPGAAAFDSGQIKPHRTFSHTFVVPGHYRYFCTPHETAGMIGEIEVTP